MTSSSSLHNNHSATAVTPVNLFGFGFFFTPALPLPSHDEGFLPSPRLPAHQEVTSVRPSPSRRCWTVTCGENYCVKLEKFVIFWSIFFLFFCLSSEPGTFWNSQAGQGRPLLGVNWLNWSGRTGLAVNPQRGH